ncbi:MAG: ABC transporter ATP-binding protein [Erysipelotrichaceae bacterium]|nr:ABC transporter ATP-binding protein [Erysipelotrichaceae bacterium]MDP3305190.1 ABC transporter ATP-binding protein [Erysipelotrichaceae bacterium]
MKLLDIKDVFFTYPDGDSVRTILDHVNVTFEKGSMYAIVGSSGSGKTTFLTLIAGLDTAQEGSITFKGKDISEIGLWEYRRNHVGMVFQSYNLIPYMTGLENVLVAMGISGKTHMKDSAYDLLDSIGIEKNKANRNVRRLSGGEQQRIAIARAMANQPDIIVADEPTGNLDGETEDTIIGLFRKLATEKDKCVIVVTHSEKVAKQADVILRLHATKGTFVIEDNR